MSKITRTRIAPTPDTDTHNIYGRGGLGSSDNADAEAVYLVADRGLLTSIISNGDGSLHRPSSWTDCQDCTLLRVAIYYRAAAGERDFMLLYRDGSGTICPGSGLFTPANSGLEAVVSSALYMAGHYFQPFDCRGMKEYAFLVAAGSVNFDIFGAAS